MTISVKHAFTSAKADGTDSTLIQPSNWNAEHTITAAAGKILGRASGTAGAIQELSLAFDSTGQSMIPPSGDTASRPTGATGMFRYNTTDNLFEYYNGTAWNSIGSALTATVTGGTGATSTLTLQSTSGIGTSDAIIFNTGSQVQAMRIRTDQNVSIGSSVGSASNILSVNKTMAGSATSRGIEYNGSITASVVTTAAYPFHSVPDVGAGTLTNLQHFRANQGTLTGTVTNQYGFNVASTMSGASTLNIGFRGDLAAATGSYNFYASGTADNYFLGDVSIGNVAVPLSKLVVSENATTTLQTAITGTLAHFANVTDTSSVLLLDSHGTATGLRNEITFRRSRGTAAAPAAITSGNQIGAITGYGYGASAYSATSRASIIMNASENWTASAQGTSIAINTTASGTITPTEVVTIGNDGIVTGTAGNLMLVSGTSVASTSGTSISFTGLPSWVKRITVMFSGVSTNGTSDYIIQLGYGATPTYVTSGYLGSVVAGGGTATSFSTGFTLNTGTTSADAHSGIATITNITGNAWTMTSILGITTNNAGRWGGGNVSTVSVLTAVRITTVGGANTFDAGTINIMYE